jgi:hypothetical protein
MGAEVPLPTDFVESLSRLRFPVQTDDRLQMLMDKNTEGTLSAEERHELEALVELGETMTWIRARALQSLGRLP